MRLLEGVWGMKIIIAHLHKGPNLRTAGGLALIIILLWAAILYSPDGHILKHILSISPFMYPVGVFSAVGCLWGLYISFCVMEKILFEDGAALWIDNGTITYISKFLLSARLSDVVEIRMGTYGQFERPGVVLKMKSGREKIFPSLALVEPSDSIITRLKEFQRGGLLLRETEKE